MFKDEYLVIGVMSGTSLDGIDLVYVKFYFNKYWSFKIIESETKKYSLDWVKKLRDLVKYSSDELQKIDEQYTQYLGDTINEFIQQKHIQKVDAICSHGHTALHQPNKGLTYQIGNLSLLSEVLNQTIVCDFRVQDVKLGGQGAPLVPIGDKLLFSEYDLCLNLGGFANISMDKNNTRIAFDICPVNIVLNHYVNKLGFDYDNKGKIASLGKINDQLLEALNSIAFYKEDYPKSLGVEWLKSEFLPIIETQNLSIKDVLRTCVEHMAFQITKIINTFLGKKVLVTGGGAYNDFLVDRIKCISNATIIIPSSEIIEYKEALIFGFLGVLKLREEVNCLSSVTGAIQNHSSGKIFQP